MTNQDQSGPTRTPTPTLTTFEGRSLANPAESLFDQGLAFDFETLMDRRRVLKLIGYGGLGAGLLALVGCAAPAATQSLLRSAAASASPPAASASSAASASPIAPATAAASAVA